MVLDDILYYIYRYGFWAILALAIAKFIFLMIYRPDIRYAASRFFYIYTDSRIVKEDMQRYQFRIWHNLLTWLLYIFIFLYGMIIFIVS